MHMNEASDLCGCRRGVLAAGGGRDAVSLQDLLGVLQHGLVAELQVELETDGERTGHIVTSSTSSVNSIHKENHSKDTSGNSYFLYLCHMAPLKDQQGV